MPDASTTDQPGQQSPQAQISTGAVAGWLGGLLGADWETASGGGGTGGQYMFADVGELNAVIQQWQTELDAINNDGVKIKEAVGFVQPPAEDGMSVGQADATRESLNTLQEHNAAMRDYAEKYIQKLIASRDHIVSTEQANEAQLRNANRS